MYDPPVHLYKTVLMQRLLDAVINGHRMHTAGTVKLCRAQPLADKFAERYGVARNANQRAYAKRTGRANARLYLLATEGSNDLGWWLLVTEGAGAVHEHERLRDAHNARARIRIGDDYELVRRTRPRTKGGGTVWTWRMTRECTARWRTRLVSACRRKSPVEINSAIVSLYRTPGFSRIRSQVGSLVTLARREWGRRHGSLEALTTPPALGYVERLSDATGSLSVLYGAHTLADGDR